MYKKFARLDYVADRSQIPVRFNLIKRGGQPGLEWYVERFNPFKIEPAKVGGAAGYDVYLPLTADEAVNDYDRLKRVYRKTVVALKDYDVEIILPPGNVKVPLPDGVKLADGKMLAPFFLRVALNKAAAAMGMSLGGAEVLLVCGSLTQCECIIDNISGDVNFLSIIADNNNLDALYNKAEQVLRESGLNICVMESAGALWESADIIINASDRDFTRHLYRRNACFFDLGGNTEQVAELKRLHDDLLVADGFTVSYRGKTLPLEVFELSFYLKSQEYRHLVQGGYSHKHAAAVAGMLKEAELSSLCVLGRKISSSELSLRRARSLS